MVITTVQPAFKRYPPTEKKLDPVFPVLIHLALGPRQTPFVDQPLRFQLRDGLGEGLLLAIDGGTRQSQIRIRNRRSRTLD